MELIKRINAAKSEACAKLAFGADVSEGPDITHFGVFEVNDVAHWLSEDVSAPVNFGSYETAAAAQMAQEALSHKILKALPLPLPISYNMEVPLKTPKEVWCGGLGGGEGIVTTTTFKASVNPHGPGVRIQIMDGEIVKEVLLLQSDDTFTLNYKLSLPWY